MKINHTTRSEHFQNLIKISETGANNTHSIYYVENSSKICVTAVR